MIRWVLRTAYQGYYGFPRQFSNWLGMTWWGLRTAYKPPNLHPPKAPLSKGAGSALPRLGDSLPQYVFAGGLLPYTTTCCTIPPSRLWAAHLPLTREALGAPAPVHRKAASAKSQLHASGGLRVTEGNACGASRPTSSQVSLASLWYRPPRVIRTSPQSEGRGDYQSPAGTGWILSTAYQGNTDCHTSEIVHWFAMTCAV